jgi:2-dehydro-3-deoxyphosphooctonate aldolase (KDO 8-P synthase)
MSLNIPKLQKYDANNFFLMAGPCAIENRDMALTIAEQLKSLTEQLKIPFIFKGSYRKANRTKADSFKGIGDEKALKILQEVSKTFDIPVVTDIHEAQEAYLAAQYVDILQIPAFLCRQSDLLEAAAKTGKAINIKKGQFLSGASMGFAIEKIKSIDPQIEAILTDRGNSFGYSDLVVDFRNIPIMQNFNVPVVMDCTHSLQKPNQSSGITGGDPMMIATIAKAAVAVGVDGLFIETHPNPSLALSDGANMLPLNQIKELLTHLVRLRQAIIL